jgi:hypothetical protein
LKTTQALLIAALCLTAAPAWAKAPLLLGMLEEPQCYAELACDYGRDKACLAEKPRKVRVLFARGADGWIALDSPDAAKPFDYTSPTWHIAFDGRNLGTVGTTDPGFHSDFASSYPNDYFLNLAPGQSLPKIRNQEGGFGGWCSVPSLRPLFVVTRPNYRDPERWKPFRPSNGDKKLLLPQVRKIMAESLCSGGTNGSDSDVPITAAQLAEITTDNIVLRKSYRDRNGRELVSVGLETKYTEECYIEEYPYLGSAMFLKAGEDVRFIGGELQLVDAGDYDGDGKSEVVFWYSGYNQDGYVLYDDDFRQRANFLWNYH